MTPSVGRIVHYVMPDGPAKGAHRPAVVVCAFNVTCVNLQVFVDGINDGVEAHQGTLWKSSVCEGTCPGSWHWPEKVD